MKTSRLLIVLLITLTIAGCKKDTPPGTERYTVTFSFNWNAQDFPTDYPANAHFSPLVGWTHAASDTFFQPGTFASPGIKTMAETGATTPLDNEIDDRIADGEGEELVIGDGLGTGVGEIEVEVLVSMDHPSVTLATMLAPSPDWYLAVVNVSLFENGEFVEEKTLQGTVYDAGTDSGPSFASPNSSTVPQDPISPLVAPPLGDGNSITPALATVRFKKKR